MLWMAAYFPSWTLQYVHYQSQLQAHAERGQDDVHAVPHQNDVSKALFDPERLTVVACDSRARASGVCSGMSVVTAEALESNIVLYPYSQDMSQQASEWLCQWSYNYSARIVPLRCSVLPQQELKHGIEDCLLLEVGSMIRLFGDLATLVRAYMLHSQQLGFAMQVAFGHTPMAAQLLAINAPVNVELGLDKPQFLQHIEQATTLERQQQQLKKLSLQALPLPQTLKVSLQAMGLDFLEQVLHLPRQALGQGEMQPLLPLLAKVQGDLPDPQRFYVFQDTYQRRCELLYDVEHREGLIFPLVRMFEELAVYLRSRQMAVLALSLKFYYRECHHLPLTIDICYPFAEYQSQALMKLCRLQLERLTLYEAVVAIELQVRQSVSQQAQTEGCLGHTHQGHSNQGQTDVKALIATLQARLGQDKVQQIITHEQHLPESSWGYVSPNESYVFGSHHGRQKVAARAQLQQQLLRSQIKVSAQASALLNELKPSQQNGLRSLCLPARQCPNMPPLLQRASASLAHIGMSPYPRTVPYANAANDQWFRMRPFASDPVVVKPQDPFVSDVVDIREKLPELSCRPNWLLPQPQPIEPTKVRLLKGPERIALPWWVEVKKSISKTQSTTSQLQEVRCRDYYIAAHHDGGLCWVFKIDQGMFIQGWFG